MQNTVNVLVVGSIPTLGAIIKKKGDIMDSYEEYLKYSGTPIDFLQKLIFERDLQNEQKQQEKDYEELT